MTTKPVRVTLPVLLDDNQVHIIQARGIVIDKNVVTVSMVRRQDLGRNSARRSPAPHTTIEGTVELEAEFEELTVCMNEVRPGDEIEDSGGDWDPIVSVRNTGIRTFLTLHPDCGGGHIIRPSSALARIRRTR